MKKCLLIFILFIFSFCLYAEEETSEIKEESEKEILPVGEEEYTPFVFSFFYPFAMNVGNADIATNAQASIISGVSGSVKGVNLAGFVAWTGKYIYGLEATTLFSFAGEKMYGVQISAGISYTAGKMYGVQLSTLSSIADEKMMGLQLSAFNMAGETKGLQLALINFADDMNGVQIGTLNFDKKVTGLQLGLMNDATDVTGLQIGIVNINDTIHGIPLGLINISRQGYIALAAYTSNIFPQNVGLQFSCGLCRSTLNFSTKNLIGGQTSLAVGLGWGLTYPLSPFYVGADFLYHYKFIEDAKRKSLDTGKENIFEIRSELGLHILTRFGIFVGVGAMYRAPNDAFSEGEWYPVFLAGVKIIRPGA